MPPRVSWQAALAEAAMAERRRRMLMLAAAGKTAQEIAIEAGCTVDTVRYTLYGTRYVKKDKGE